MCANKKDKLLLTQKTHVKKGLVYSSIEGSFAAAMISFGTNFVSAFAVNALQSNALKNSLITYLPSFLLSVSQLLSGWLSDKMGKRKIIVLVCVLFQSLSWLAIFWVSYYTRSITLLITLFTLNTVIGYFGNTPWTSWLGSLIPDRKRGKYFGKRETVINLSLLISSAAAGFIITSISKTDVFAGFGIAFHLAALFRFISFIYLMKQYEPPYSPPEVVESLISIKTFLQYKNYIRFVIFNFFLYWAVGFCSANFTIYILRDLRFDYFQFTMTNLASALGMMIFSGYWGMLRDKYGSLYAYKVSVLPVFVIALLWYLSGNYYILLFSMILSGFCWSGVKISSLNVFYDHVPEKDRNRVYGVGSIFATFGAVFGAVVGGIAVDYFISLKQSMLISAIIRFILPVVLFTGIIRRKKHEPHTPPIIFQFTAGIPVYLYNRSVFFFRKLFFQNK